MVGPLLAIIKHEYLLLPEASSLSVFHNLYSTT